FPTTVKALLYDSTYVDLPVTWEQTTLDTTVPGTYSLKGKVSGFPNDVLLKGTIKPKPESYEKLKDALVKLLGTNLKNVGISFCDLTHGTTFSLNGDKQFLAASTAKVPIVMILYDLIKEGRLTEEQLVTYKSWEYQGGTGILQYRDLSKPIPFRTLAEYAIRYSDNIAIIMIQNNMCKRSELNERLRTMIGSDLNNGKDNILTANQAQAILKILYHGANEGNVGYQQIVEWLKNTVFHDRLDRNIEHSIVAHKTGNLREATNDIGIFYTNKPYILTVYTSFLSKPNAVISSISDLVYDYQAKYGN
ncbi:MAG: serine hydrolase, partial [Desulfosporosinus sp.]